jgi:transcriptional regulator with XRE-family HTH domain
MSEAQHATGLSAGAFLLRAWLDEHGMSQRDFSALARISEGLISRYLSGDVAPGPLAIERIQRATGGEITLIDWVSAAA